MSFEERTVIVGASIAGVTAAEALRNNGYQGSVTIIGEEPHLPYNRPPLSKQMLLGGWESSELCVLSESQISALNISLHLGERALGLDVEKKIVTTTLGQHSFDKLIIATGSKPRVIQMTEGLPTLRTIEDSAELLGALRQGKSIGIFGAGVLGSEVASAAVKFGCKTTLIGKPNEITFGSMGGSLSHLLEPLHLSNGVDLLLGEDVKRIIQGDSGVELVSESGNSHAFDFVLSAIGTVPCTEWLAGSGLDITNGVICDSKGECSPGIFAVGDVAAWPNLVSGEWSRIEHQSGAIEQALAVALTISKGMDSEPPLPLFWSEIHGVKIKALGWFQGGQLEEVPSEVEDSHLFLSKKNEMVQGAIAWNASNTEFRQARKLVEESLERNFRTIKG